MIEERREKIKNQIHVKTCKRFVTLATFSNYSEVDPEIDPEILLQELEDSKGNCCGERWWIYQCVICGKLV